MVKRNLAMVLGADCFNDPVDDLVMYCGDWWRTRFFMNLTVGELLGEPMASTPRVLHLAEVLQIDMNWKINEVSDGQRRRCQLLQILSKPRPVYLMDEITSDPIFTQGKGSSHSCAESVSCEGQPSSIAPTFLIIWKTGPPQCCTCPRVRLCDNAR